MTEVENPARRRDIENCIHPYTNPKTHLNKGPLIITGGARGSTCTTKRARSTLRDSPASGAPVWDKDFLGGDRTVPPHKPNGCPLEIGFMNHSGAFFHDL